MTFKEMNVQKGKGNQMKTKMGSHHLGQNFPGKETCQLAQTFSSIQAFHLALCFFVYNKLLLVGGKKIIF